MSPGKRDRARSRERRRHLRIGALWAKGQDGGGVYTSSDPPPPCPQVFLNFPIGFWSGADVEIAAAAATTAASAAA